jgi:hypothetical protein
MIKLTITDKQAKLISRMCDICSRLYAGQVQELEEFHKLPRERMLDIKNSWFPELNNNASYGIVNTQISDNARILYDMHQVIRHWFAWRNQKNTPKTRNWSEQIGVSFDNPWKTGDQPLINIEDTNMQYLFVKATKEGKKQDLPIYIDGIQNGYTNGIIKLDEGTIDVRVEDQETTIDLENTTYSDPLVVDINL